MTRSVLRAMLILGTISSAVLSAPTSTQPCSTASTRTLQSSDHHMIGGSGVNALEARSPMWSSCSMYSALNVGDVVDEWTQIDKDLAGDPRIPLELKRIVSRVKQMKQGLNTAMQLGQPSTMGDEVKEMRKKLEEMLQGTELEYENARIVANKAFETLGEIDRGVQKTIGNAALKKYGAH
ncbi:hypothetical protein C8R42DRAFT_637070 [Lentinula raphanica]|nr:hypothetical protein C8R42DRAFT_637070 [Lentinula raphanica]